MTVEALDPETIVLLDLDRRARFYPDLLAPETRPAPPPPTRAGKAGVPERHIRKFDRDSNVRRRLRR